MVNSSSPSSRLAYTCTHITPNLREYKIAIHPPPPLFDPIDYLLGSVSAACIFFQFVTSHTIGVSFTALFFTLLIVIHVMFRMNSVIEESLLVIRDTGVQINKRYFNGKQKHIFVEKTLISAILINEAAVRFQFIFYMAFSVHREPNLVMAFEV